MSENIEGKIITFYSYKGGVGRSMALANIATKLAMWGKKVLMVDWDLEAPGLEYFFKEFLNEQIFEEEPGLIDLLNDSIEKNNINFQNYERQINLKIKGKLSIITSGKRDDSYFKKVKNFDFTEFYKQNEGEVIIEKLKSYWKRNYDFILIDSRTGITEVGSICTIQLPDIVFLLFGTAKQGLNGTLDVVCKIGKSVKLLEQPKYNVLTIPIPSRINPLAETSLLSNWLDNLAILFTPHLKYWWPYSLDENDESYRNPRDLIEQLFIPAVPKFEFGESLPVMKEKEIDFTGIIVSYERIAALIADGFSNVKLFLESGDFVERVSKGEVGLLESQKRKFKTYSIFISGSSDSSIKSELRKNIHDINNEIRRNNIFFESRTWEDMSISQNNSIEDSIHSSDLFVFVADSKIGSDSLDELEVALKSNKNNNIPRIIFYQNQNLAEDYSNKINKNINEITVEYNFNFLPFLYSGIDHLKNNLRSKLLLFIDSGGMFYTQPASLLSPNGPAEPPIFLGRENELLEIRKRLDTGGKLILINAEGGIGKTTLAAKYWHVSMQDYKHNAWLFCEGGITNSLKELAPKLNIDLSNYATEEEQIKALKQALSQVHDDFLLVLDNANDEDDILAFKQEFEGFHWHVIITSRCHGVLEKGQELTISNLSPPLAKALFERYYNEPNNTNFEQQVERIIKALNYHTLLIEVFAKNIYEAKGITSMQEFIEKLETEGLFMGEDSFEIQAEYAKEHINNEKASTDDILAALYDFSPLAETEDLRAALVAFAVLPAENYDIEFLFTLFTNLEKGEKKKYKEQLKNLNSKGWISQTNDEYRISPVIQKLVLDKHKESLGSDTHTLLDKLNELLDNDAYNLTKLSLPAAQPYVNLVEHITKSLKANPSGGIATLNYGAGIYYSNTGYLVSEKKSWQSYQINYQLLLEKEPENLSYKNNLAVSYSKLGGIYEQTGDWKNALNYYEEYFGISKEIYESSPENLSYKNGLAISYSKVGGIYEQTGDWKNALINYEEYFRISKEIYESSPENLSNKNGLAISYEKLGGIYEQTGDLKNALINYEEYFRISKEIYESSPENLSYKNGLAISYEKLGGIYEQTGDWKNALINYEEDFRITKEIYESSPENLSYKNGLAISYYKLGHLYEKVEINKAIENLEFSVSLYQELVSAAPELVEFSRNFGFIKEYLEKLKNGK